MGLVNKTTLNFVVESGKLGKNLLSKPTKVTCNGGLRSMPQQLSADAAEISQKAVQGAKDAVEPATLQKLSDKGLSLNQMSSELAMPMGTVRFYLQKFGIITDAQQEFRLLKEYFTATTREGKAKAFREIDKYLKQIAKEEHKLKANSTFEDCLQDVRLRFFEIVDKSKKEGVSFPYSILRTIRESKPVLKPEIKTVGISKTDVSVADRELEVVENKDYENYLWQFFYRHLRQRDALSLEQLIREDKSIKEIASFFYLTTARMRTVLKEALPKLETQFELAKACDYFPERIKVSHKAVESAKLKEIDKPV